MSNEAKPAQGKSWRDVLPVHPAADLFPLMSPDELRELGEDIAKNGPHQRIVLWAEDVADDLDDTEWQVLDGRNRLDALELMGTRLVEGDGPSRACQLLFAYELGIDPYAYVLSANIHRRHLTAEQKREIIAKVIKAKLEASNRQIAKQVKADDKTVGKVRRELEATADIPQLDKTTGADGRARPAKKKKRRDVDDFLAEKRAREAKDSEPEITPEAPEQLRERGGEAEVAPPEEVKSNILDTIEHHKAVASAYRRIWKNVLAVSQLDQTSKDEVSAAISALINTWQSVQRVLARRAPTATPTQDVEPEITTAVTDTARAPVEIPDLPEFLRRTA
jgi:hypothetical protein